MTSLRSFLVFAGLFLGCEFCWAAEVDQRLAAGEFGAAMQIAETIPVGQRDPILAQIASAQSSTGETTAAGGTLRGISSASSRGEAIEGTRGAGAGGGSFADFQSLIDLIQTTVVPDTWEALGGPSTMAPYPQGVYVDAEGTVRQCETFASSNAVDDSEIAAANFPGTAGRRAVGLETTVGNAMRFATAADRRVDARTTQCRFNSGIDVAYGRTLAGPIPVHR